MAVNASVLSIVIKPPHLSHIFLTLNFSIWSSVSYISSKLSVCFSSTFTLLFSSILFNIFCTSLKLCISSTKILSIPLSTVSNKIFSIIELFLYNTFGIWFAFKFSLCFFISFHFLIVCSISFFIASSLFPSEAVLIIKPISLFIVSLAILISLFLSFSSSIFWETAINLSFGISTTNLPGMCKSVLIFAPFKFVASFFTCTKILLSFFI